MPSTIESAAQMLRGDGLGFTERNLLFAVRRAGGGAITELEFRGVLRRCLARGPLEGLLPSRSSGRMRTLARDLAEMWDAAPPAAVLLVDRSDVARTFMASGACRSERL